MLLRRFYSTARTLNGTSHDIASEFLSRCKARGPLIQKQLIDPNQLHRLAQALGRQTLLGDDVVTENAPKNGTAVPPGYHLAYFTPSCYEEELGNDGSDKTFNPLPPFTRRMWAGGAINWFKDNLLRVGDNATETTTILRAEPKKTRDGTEMIVVGVEKKIENDKGVALIDQRNWVFRPQIISPIEPLLAGKDVPFVAGKNTRDFIQTPVSLFRFSALTFNAHKIHYSKQWCREVEGHRDLVVHGPLNLINMLDLWRDSIPRDSNQVPGSVEYRALSPVYVGEEYRAVLEEGGHEISQSKIKFWTQDGKLAMQGSITI